MLEYTRREKPELLKYGQGDVEEDAQGQVHPDTIRIFAAIVLQTTMPIRLHHFEPTVPHESGNIKDDNTEFENTSEDFPRDADRIHSSVIRSRIF